MHESYVALTDAPSDEENASRQSSPQAGVWPGCENRQSIAVRFPGPRPQLLGDLHSRTTTTTTAG